MDQSSDEDLTDEEKSISEDIDPESALMSKLGIKSVNDLKPSGKQLQKALKYFDLGVKIEVTMVSAN